MTHQARAAAIVEKIWTPEIDTKEAVVVDFVWRELVDACNGELERRREVEQARDRAIRIQAALEIRNQQLQDWLEGLMNIITLEDEPLPDGQLVHARQLLEEFDLSGGSDV